MGLIDRMVDHRRLQGAHEKHCTRTHNQEDTGHAHVHTLPSTMWWFNLGRLEGEPPKFLLDDLPSRAPRARCA